MKRILFSRLMPLTAILLLSTPAQLTADEDIGGNDRAAMRPHIAHPKPLPPPPPPRPMPALPKSGQPPFERLAEVTNYVNSYLAAAKVANVQNNNENPYGHILSFTDGNTPRMITIQNTSTFTPEPALADALPGFKFIYNWYTNAVTAIAPDNSIVVDIPNPWIYSYAAGSNPMGRSTPEPETGLQIGQAESIYANVGGWAGGPTPPQVYLVQPNMLSWQEQMERYQQERTAQHNVVATPAVMPPQAPTIAPAPTPLAHGGIIHNPDGTITSANQNGGLGGNDVGTLPGHYNSTGHMVTTPQTPPPGRHAKVSRAERVVNALWAGEAPAEADVKRLLQNRSGTDRLERAVKNALDTVSGRLTHAGGSMSPDAVANLHQKAQRLHAFAQAHDLLLDQASPSPAPASGIAPAPTE